MITIPAFSSLFLSGLYLFVAVAFILTLQGLTALHSAFRSNILGLLAMALCVGGTAVAFLPATLWPVLCVAALGAGVGAVIAKRVPMTALPQLMAAFHSLVGLAAVFIALSAFKAPFLFGLTEAWTALRALEVALGSFVGALTFTGSVVAFLKLEGRLAKGFALLSHKATLYASLVLAGVGLVLFLQAPELSSLLLLTFLGLFIGVALVMPIGGADMPVVVSMLNSYSGWAAVGIGFTLSQFLLVIVGALVGASGAILSYIMCKGMNRPFLKVLLGGAASAATQSKAAGQKAFKQGGADDAAFLLKNAQSVVIVPGYGMAVARAQHALKEVADLLKAEGVKVRFAIHPVAGRMPGHMNVLLAEAEINTDDVLELEDINADFTSTDVVLVIGANDITNPVARSDQSSPLYGMSILDVDKAKTVLFIKRSLGVGYAGVDNPLFYNDKTYMLLGDGKKMMEHIAKAVAA